MTGAAELREDAPEPLALERERRLQRCRERLRAGVPDRRRGAMAPKPWTADDLPELMWVHALAEAGHVGARRLRDDVLEDEERYSPVLPLAPDFFASVGKTHRQVALTLVKLECAKPAPAAERLQRWLALLPERGDALAAAAGELAAAAGLTAENAAIVATAARQSGGGRRSSEQFIADLLWRCANTGGPHAQRLAARAALLGSPRARLAYVLAGDARFASEQGDSWWTELCAAIREVRAIDPLTAGDRDYLRRQLDTVADYAGDAPGEPKRAAFLHEIAQARAELGQRDVAARLMLRAAELGSPHARLELALGAEPDARFPLEELPGAKWRELGAAIGEARVLRQLDAQACAFFRGIVEPRGEVRIQRGTTYGAPLRGILLWQLAASRLPGGERAGLPRLRKRAAELGCIDAITTCIGQDLGELRAWLAAGDKLGQDVAHALSELPGLSPADLVRAEALLRKWLGTGGLLRRTASALAMLAGAAVELGEHGGPPDRNRAIELYAAATFTTARDPQTGAWRASFCWEVARRFDPADAAMVRELPALALAWYERAAAMGGQLSLQRLLEAHASADLGLPRDAGAVLRRLGEYLAEPGHRLDPGEAEGTAEALRRCAREDPANAAAWNAAADRLLAPSGG